MRQILVVDDEIGIRELLSEILSDEGYDVQLAENAGAARAFRSQARPDLVLLDMHLPDISGLELLRHIKQDDGIADIPVIVVSADATAQQTQAALTSGALRYITKPVDVAQLLQIVDGVLEAAETRWG